MRHLLIALALVAAACSGDDAAPCVPATCGSLGASCGTFGDGCDGTITCGSCSGGDVCGAGGVPGVCAQRLCTAAGWCWENPLPQGNPLFAVWGREPSDVWAVGPLGTIIHFDGTRWAQSPGATDELIQDVWASSASDAWAVGAQGVILHFDGERWTRIDSPTPKSLIAVFGFARDDVWAVGVDGAVLRFRGTAWEIVEGVTQKTLFALWGPAPNDLWIVGASETLHWNGASFEPFTIELGQDVLSVFGTARDDIWAAGRQGRLWHWNGNAWSRVSSGVPLTLFALWGPARDELVAVGANGLLISYDGGGWAPTRLGLDGNGVTDGESLQDVWGWGDDAWIVGTRGSLYRHRRDWVRVDSERPAEMRGLWIGAGDVAFAGGTDATLLRWDGVTWSKVPVGNEGRDIRGAWGAADGDVWVVGDGGLMLHWNGAAFTTVGAGTTQPLNAVSGTGANDAWAVGDNGTIIRWTGTAGGWSTVPSGTQQRLLGVAAVAADDVWAVGEGGTILRWRGSRWDPVASGVTSDLRAVWAAGSAAFAVGDAGVALRWSGSAWVPEITNTDDILHSVWATGPDDVWAVGGAEFEFAGARVLHRTASGWADVETGSILALRAVAGSGSRLFVAGVGGTILSKN